MQTVEEEMRELDHKIKQLRLDYEQYFLGNRPREPQMLRADVQKTIIRFSNQAIQNTALRFKFSSLTSRFHAFKRQWDQTLREIDAGTYARHKFKANLHERDTGPSKPAPRPPGGAAHEDLYETYVRACRSCGQDVANLTREKLAAVIDKQEATLRDRYGGAQIRFRVAVENGKAKLKASPVRKRS